MIGDIDISRQIQNPSLKGEDIVACKDSPQMLHVLGIPQNAGDEKTSKVQLLVNFPDGTSVKRTCMRKPDGTYVCSFRGCSAVGTVDCGVQFIATLYNKKQFTQRECTLAKCDLKII